MRVRMLPPILPSPTRPMCIRDSLLTATGGPRSGNPWPRGGSGEQPARHEQVAERRVAVAAVGCSADHHRLGRLGESQLHDVLVDDGQAVEQELRVEAGGDRLAVDLRVDRLRGLGLVAGAGVEGQHLVAERQLEAVLRSATRETRRTDSISACLSTFATVRCSLGNRLRTLGNSPSSSRVVVRRVPPAAAPSKPMMPSPEPEVARAIVTSVPLVSDLAVSPRTLAGTSATTVSSGVRGSQVSSRWESRNRSVASSEIVEPSISIRTPVSTGSMSSRPAAGTAWAAAGAEAPRETVPVAAGISGRLG